MRDTLDVTTLSEDCLRPPERLWPTRKELRRMAKNTGNDHRIGAVKDRSQFVLPNGHHVKRDDSTGRFVDVKADKAPFKGVREEK